MSNVPLFPQDEETSSNSESIEDKQFKRPAFILIDERNGKNQYTHFDADASHKPQDASEEQRAKGPISLRFVCLLGFIFCVVFGLGMLLWSLALTGLTILTLFQNKNFTESMFSFWKLFINTFIAGFGFTLGMISPTLGLGLIALYFSLATDLVEEDLLRKVIKRSFNQF